VYTYLLLNIIAIVVPVYYSFDKRTYFFGDLKYFMPAMLITLFFFISWDILFTYFGVWGFNPKYLTGITIINLPLEEWLFFVTIPYACVFTYISLNYLIKKDYFGNFANYISWVLIILLSVISISYYQRIYTSITFGLTAIMILLHVLVLKTSYMGRFYFSYLFILAPFLIINGILTGSFIEEQVVWYDDTQNLGIRIFTIPVEDTVYGMLLVLMNVTFFEAFRSRFKKRPIPV
jgi:lycopene cyclase domain-containing protein